MLQLSKVLPPRPEASWKLIRQARVDNMVGALKGAEQDQRMFASIGSTGWESDADRNAVPWGLAALKHNKELCEKLGFTLIAAEGTAPIDKTRLAPNPEYPPKQIDRESNDHPVYEMLGRMYASDYIRGLGRAPYGHPAKR